MRTGVPRRWRERRERREAERRMLEGPLLITNPHQPNVPQKVTFWHEGRERVFIDADWRPSRQQEG